MTASPETADGMAWALIPSGEVAGPTSVRATADADRTVRGSAVRIDEVPGTVRDITLTAIETTVLADGRSVVALHTGELSDAFGNTLAEGTIAQFLHLPYVLARSATIWCVAMLCLATLMTFLSGRESLNWQRTEQLLREILAKQNDSMESEEQNATGTT